MRYFFGYTSSGCQSSQRYIVGSNGKSLIFQILLLDAVQRSSADATEYRDLIAGLVDCPVSVHALGNRQGTTLSCTTCNAPRVAAPGAG
jgi:hypothetical protein